MYICIYIYSYSTLAMAVVIHDFGIDRRWRNMWGERAQNSAQVSVPSLFLGGVGIWRVDDVSMVQNEKWWFNGTWWGLNRNLMGIWGETIHFKGRYLGLELGQRTDKAMLWLPSPQLMPKCSLEQDGVDEILNQLVSIRGDFVTKVNTV